MVGGHVEGCYWFKDSGRWARGSSLQVLRFWCRRMGRLVLRRILLSSFSNSTSLECLGATCRLNCYKEKRSFMPGWDVLRDFGGASGIRTLTTESDGKGGDEKGGGDGKGGDGKGGDAKGGDGKGGDDEKEKRHQPTLIDGGKKYSVVHIDSDGSWQTVWRNAVELGVHPRDVSILADSNPFISQRSTITVVHNYKIMVRMENARALLCRDHVLLFEARRPRSYAKERDIVGAAPDIARPQFQEKAAARARELFAAYMSQHAREPIAHVLDAMPFHLRMLECLLDDTSSLFYQKTERLKVVVERMLEELTGDVNIGGLQRLLPLKRALTEVEHDVKDTHNALEEVLNSDEMLEAICLNKPGLLWSFLKGSNVDSGKEDPNQPTLRQAAADMLLTYQRQIDNAGGALEELRKNIDATQEIWELGLDTTRNRLFQMDLLFSLGTFSLSVAALMAAYFGMNIPSGMEESPNSFRWVVMVSIGTTLFTGTTLLFLVRIWPRVIDHRRAQELAGLRDLLDHLDDIDDIFQAVAKDVAGKSVTPTEFKRVLQSHPTAKFMRKTELDLMFRMFDTDKDGVLENVSEMHGQLQGAESKEKNKKDDKNSKDEKNQNDKGDKNDK